MGASCAHPDPDRPINRLPGLWIGIYTQDGHVVNRNGVVAETLGEDDGSYYGLHYGGFGLGLVGAGLVAGGFALRSDEPGAGVHPLVPAGVGAAVAGTVLEILARFVLDGAIVRHNEALARFEAERAAQLEAEQRLLRPRAPPPAEPRLSAAGPSPSAP